MKRASATLKPQITPPPLFADFKNPVWDGPQPKTKPEPKLIDPPLNTENAGE